MAVTVTAPSQPHRLAAETYEQIVASGALEGAHIELLDGLLVDMYPATPLHDELITRLVRQLSSADAVLRVQMGLHCAEDSIPEPDLALVEPGDYSERRPTTALLVVEVAVSSQELDRGRKAELYAGAAVPVYWIVNATDHTVEMLSKPHGGTYREREVHSAGAKTPSPAAGVEALDVATLFGRLR